jgi:hypothetical protein
MVAVMLNRRGLGAVHDTKSRHSPRWLRCLNDLSDQAIGIVYEQEIVIVSHPVLRVRGLL